MMTRIRRWRRARRKPVYVDYHPGFHSIPEAFRLSCLQQRIRLGEVSEWTVSVDEDEAAERKRQEGGWQSC